MATYISVTVGERTYKFPSNINVACAKKQIREDLGLINGFIECNGIVIYDEDLMEVSKTYAFIGGQSIQSKFSYYCHSSLPI